MTDGDRGERRMTIMICVVTTDSHDGTADDVDRSTDIDSQIDGCYVILLLYFHLSNGLEPTSG